MKEHKMLYEGKRVRILQSQVVQCGGKAIGVLVQRCDDQQRWWDLENANPKRDYLPDHVFSNIAQKKTIQHIGKYLDAHFANK